MENITAVILTKNEEKNIKRCILSINKYIKNIVVIDSYSTDRTCDIANKLGAKIFIHEFEDYARQFNWAVDNVVQTPWVFRIDADEQATDALMSEIKEEINSHKNDEVNAMIVKYKIFFMGKFLRYGGVYPFKKISVYKKKFARFEERKFGEHVVLEKGETIELKNDCNHHDFKDIHSFIAKHNWYASREVVDFYERNNINQKSLYGEAEKAKKMRDNYYYKLPLFFRAKLLYIYKYYFKLGFLDGKEGKIYALLQTYFYRIMVDAKLYETKKYGENIYDETGGLNA